MAVVARNQHTRQSALPFKHDSLRDETIQLPFLYPQPQPSPPRDSRKAQKMLGLVTEFPASRRATFDIPIREPNKAQRTLGIVNDISRNRRTSWRASVGGGAQFEGSLEGLMKQAERDVRTMSGLHVPGESEEARDKKEDEKMDVINEYQATREWVDDLLEQESAFQDGHSRPSPSSERVSTLLIHSPKQISPPSPIDLDLSSSNQQQEQDIPRPLQVRRARPTSFAPSFSSSSVPNRSSRRIASSRSRGLTSDSMPNFSRPLSEIPQSPVPGEHMERDPLHVRYLEPPTPSSPTRGAAPFMDRVREARAQVEEQMRVKKQAHGLGSGIAPTKAPDARPKKTRWTSLPVPLMKWRRASKTEHGQVDSGKRDSKRKDSIDLTEENLQRWEDEVGYVPKMYRLGYDILKSPVEGDMEVERGTGTPAPSSVQLLSVPKLEDLILTPPATPPLFRHSFASATSATPSLSRSRSPAPDRSSQLSLAVQKEIISENSTPLVTCTICKEVEHPSSFPTRRITSACTHPTQTCLDCLRSWIHTCVETRWDDCTCPECGLSMGYEDVQAFAQGNIFERYDTLATRAALSAMQDFHYCQRLGCDSGQIHTASLTDSPVFVCTSCEHKHCLNHPTTPYHVGLTCVQHDHVTSISSAQQQAEQAGLRTVQETSKRCPNAVCGWWIQKSEGCDHMTCWKCGFEFCWECGASFGVIGRKGGKFHRKHCRYWG